MGCNCAERRKMIAESMRQVRDGNARAAAAQAAAVGRSMRDDAAALARRAQERMRMQAMMRRR
jgi:hypothetical protein